MGVHAGRVVGAAAAGVLLLSLCHATEGEEVHTPKVLELPKPMLDGELSVEGALAERRSVRTYSERQPTRAELGQLLWAAQGVNGSLRERTNASAGALFPLDLFVVVGRIDGVGQGLYHYRPDGHEIELVREGDVRPELSAAALGQNWVREAPAVLVIGGVVERTAVKYGERARRYVLIEVGSVAQSVSLQCEALGLGTVAVGAFRDEQVQAIIGDDVEPFLLMPVGDANRGS
jgi:SagB-type dehydrogenase family enzyme